MKQIIVTTSWDDGHRLDVRLAELLQKYDLAGTFYISPQDREIEPTDRLKPAQIKRLSQRFEIGAHTMTHPRLTKISDVEAEQEIAESKTYLEKLTAKKIISFCYPGGNYRPKHVAMVSQAGMQYARTCRRYRFDLKGSLFEAGTSVHAYRHFQDIWKILRFAGFKPLKAVQYWQWDQLAMAMFDRVMAEGGVYHLWGHSWEIEAHGDWQKLEAVLGHIARHKNAHYLTNGELVQLKKRKLLVAAPYFPPHLGGQENYAFQIAKQLQEQHGWEVIVATSGDRGWRIDKTVYEGLTVYRLPYLFKLSNTPFHPLWFWWLRQIIKKQDIEVINAHAPVPGMADVAIRAAGRWPTFVTYHMLSMKKGQRPADWLINFYEKIVLPRSLQKADAVICTSLAVNNFLQKFSSKAFIVTPGVDGDFYNPPKKTAEQIILFVGSLNKSDGHKGLRYLLEAFSLTLTDYPEAKLMIAGGGSGQPNYEAMAKRLGIAKQANFLGGCYGQELKRAYQQASVFVLPSLNDNFPLVILEAMASGLPVISTTVGGIPEMVEDAKTGYLVRPADSQALASKLRQLFANPKLARQFGELGRQKIDDNLNWSRQAQKTDQLLRTGSL